MAVGSRQATARILQTPVMEEIAVRIRLLEIALDAMTRECEKRDAALDWYRCWYGRLPMDTLPEV